MASMLQFHLGLVEASAAITKSTFGKYDKEGMRQWGANAKSPNMQERGGVSDISKLRRMSTKQGAAKDKQCDWLNLLLPFGRYIILTTSAQKWRSLNLQEHA